MPHVIALQETISQLKIRFESNSETLKTQMDSDSFFKVEVVTKWGRPQNFIDSFTQNHT